MFRLRAHPPAVLRSREIHAWTFMTSPGVESLSLGIEWAWRNVTSNNFAELSLSFFHTPHSFKRNEAYEITMNLLSPHPELGLFPGGLDVTSIVQYVLSMRGKYLLPSQRENWLKKQKEKSFLCRYHLIMCCSAVTSFRVDIYEAKWKKKINPQPSSCLMYYFCIQKLEIREISIIFFYISRVSQQAGVKYFSYLSKLIWNLARFQVKVCTET